MAVLAVANFFFRQLIKVQPVVRFTLVSYHLRLRLSAERPAADKSYLPDQSTPHDR